MKNIIFDFDGTIVNSEIFFKDCFDFALEPFGFSLERNFIEEVRHRHPSKIFDDLLAPPEAKEALRRLSQKGQEFLGKMKAFEGVPELIRELHGEGFPLAIWTGRDGVSALAILESLKLTSFFSIVVSGTCVENNKPNHEGVLKILGHWNADPKDVVIVGDHAHDVVPAQELGCTSVHACWKEKPHQLPDGVRADFEFTKVTDFRGWLLATKS